jgi:hypothetical protein
MNSRRWDTIFRWCPLFWWAITFFILLFAGEYLYPGSSQNSATRSVIVIVGAAVAAATVLEVIVHRGWTCSFLPERLYARLLMYLAAAIVGALLLSTLTEGVAVIYRVVAFLLFVVPIFASVVAHTERDHLDHDQSIRTRVLTLLAQWPLYLLVTFVVAALVVLIFGKRVVM